MTTKPRDPTQTSMPEETPTDDAPLPLQSSDLLQLMYDPPVETPPSDILTRPAFGQANQSVAMEESEQESFAWTRNNYHAFIRTVEQIEAAQAAGLEASMDSGLLRDYVLKQLIGMSGHPDAKVAAKALDMLAKSKYVGLYEEKRSKPPEDMSNAEMNKEILRLLGTLNDKAA